MSATPACEHVFVKCFPSGPRDNNEYFMACRKCGAEPAAEADPAPSSPACPASERPEGGCGAREVRRRSRAG